MTAPVIVWFQNDLRIADNPALAAAAALNRPVLPIFILDDAISSAWKMGGASRWWLHHSLRSLGDDLRNRFGLRLVLRRGPAHDVLGTLVTESGADTVLWNRRYEPFHRARDQAIKQTLRARSITVESFNGALLFEPWTIKTKTSGPFQVFTPFWRACLEAGVPGQVLAPPATLNPAADVATDPLDTWALRPQQPDWATGIGAAWQPGEAAAMRLWQDFIDHKIDRYLPGRDFPGEEAVSRLSPYLHFGEISPRHIWQMIHVARQYRGDPTFGAGFLRQLGWREFSYHLLYHFPDLPDRNFRSGFDQFPWRRDPDLRRRWQQGETGYPIVDAGMRQLWQTGWMHNRVRMIAASFLVKHLLQPWQDGARWFWDTLVDADLANNSASWQWVAGSGADAAPYFRIFNPVLQAEKFDSSGAYVRHWLPALAGLPDSYLHRPWQAPDAILRAAGIRLGETYPFPMVDHAVARQAALAAYRGRAT